MSRTPQAIDGLRFNLPHTLACDAHFVSYFLQRMGLATLKAIAPSLIQGSVPEPVLNRLEMIVRAYDPCLSCATH